VAECSQVELPRIRVDSDLGSSRVKLLLGFDPGGEDGFGWCVAELQPELPLTIRAAGVSSGAGAAIEAAHAHVNGADEIAGVGIDAPMFWQPMGDREVDKVVRTQLRERGARSPGGTVQSPNSLRGACVVQGMMLGLLYRRRIASVPITESHPKAMLWLLGHATRQVPVGGITLRALTSEFVVSDRVVDADHARDAALATLSCWAMVAHPHPPGWQDLFPLEPLPVETPIGIPLAYWMPTGQS
jgi:Protein of unknown function (DUF429)